jgi:hypothetical protein
VRWKNNTIPHSIFHIHGSHDWVLPYRFVKADYTIRKGGHLLPLYKAKELNELLMELIVNS